MKSMKMSLESEKHEQPKQPDNSPDGNKRST